MITYPLWIKLGAKDGASPALSKFAAKTMAIGKSMRMAGAAMSVAVTAPALLAGASVIRTASDFDYATRRVAALTQAQAGDFERLKDQATALGAATRYNAIQAAEAQGNLAQAGFKVNEILAATPGVMDLAAAANLDLGETARIASQAIRGYGLEASATTRIADLFTLASIRANQDLSQLGEAFTYGGPVARGFGMELEEAVAIMSKFADVGFQGEKGGNALKTALSSLAKIKPKTEAARILESYGVGLRDVFDESGNIRDFTGLLEQLAAGGIQAGQVFTIFGQRAAPPLLSLLKGGIGDVRGFTEELRGQGAAAQTAGILMGGTFGATERLSGAFETLKLKIADSGLLEAFTSLVTLATDWIEKANEANPNTIRMILIFTALFAVLGPVLIVLGSLITVGTAVAGVLAFVTGAVWSLTAAILANPIGGMIALFLAAIWIFRRLAQEIFGTESVVFKFFDIIWQGWKFIGKYIFGVIGKVLGFVGRMLGTIGKALGLEALSGLSNLTGIGKDLETPDLPRETVNAERLGNVRAAGATNVEHENRIVIDASNLPAWMSVKPDGPIEGKMQLDRGGILAT